MNKYELKEIKDIKLSKKYRNEFKESCMENLSYQQNLHEVYKEPKPTRFKKLYYLKEYTKHIITSLQCALTQHKIIDESWGGPESGGESGYCTRCDYSYHQIMY
jgi:hypothetical protein